MPPAVQWRQVIRALRWRRVVESAPRNAGEGYLAARQPDGGNDRSSSHGPAGRPLVLNHRTPPSNVPPGGIGRSAKCVHTRSAHNAGPPSGNRGRGRQRRRMAGAAVHGAALAVDPLSDPPGQPQAPDGAAAGKAEASNGAPPNQSWRPWATLQCTCSSGPNLQRCPALRARPVRRHGYSTVWWHVISHVANGGGGGAARSGDDGQPLCAR